MKACKFRRIGIALCDLELQVSLHLSLESQIHQHLYNGRSHVKSVNHNRQPTFLPTQHTKIGNSVGLENLKPICTMAKSMLKNETKCTASCSTNTENLGHVDTEKRAIDCHAIGSRGYKTQAQDFADTAMEVHLQGFLCASESITSIISSYQTTYEEYRLVR